MEKGTVTPLPESYWIIGKGGMYLADGVNYTNSLSKARRFESFEAAKLFAFDGRPERGDTYFQKIAPNSYGHKFKPTMGEYIMAHLKLTSSSVMDNIELLKISVEKFG